MKKKEQRIQTISVQKAKKRIDAGASVLDVRTPLEYRRRRLENAVNVPLGTSAFDAELQRLEKTRPYVVYCRTGGRSERAMAAMKKQGFSEVYNMAGGITAWRAAGYPTVSILQSLLGRTGRRN